MLSRVILSTEHWRVTVGMFGLGSIQAINTVGESAIATATEKAYFLQVLRALRSTGVPITTESPVAIAVVTDFAKAIHQRFRRTTSSGGFAYAVFFSTYSPEETARRYIEKFAS